MAIFDLQKVSFIWFKLIYAKHTGLGAVCNQCKVPGTK